MPTSSGSGRPSANAARSRAKRTIIPVRLLSAIVIVLVIVLAALILLTRKPAKQVAAEIDEGNFYEGITINSIDVSGKSLAEGKELVKSSAEAKLAKARLTLQYKGQTWAITSEEMSLSTDLDDVLHKAMAVGRDGTAVENLSARNKAKDEGMNFDTGFVVDENALRSRVERVALEIDQEPVEPSAEYHPDVENPEERLTYVAGKEGYKVDVYATTTESLKALQSNSDNPVNIVVNTVACASTIEQIQSRTKQISSFSTSFKDSGLSVTNRVKNIQKACSIINGLTLQPGDEFSFNDYVGERNEKNGFFLANTIVGGNRYEENYGGGICQVSTTLYNALLRAGIDFKSMVRDHHTYPSSYVPVGMDATVSWGGPEFKFTNTLEYAIYVYMTVDTKQKTVTATVFGPELPNGQKIDLRSKVIKTFDPEEPEVVEDETQPAGFERTLITAHVGQVAEVYIDRLDKDGKVINSQLLYTDTYRAVRGVKSVGIGTGTVDIPEE